MVSPGRALLFVTMMTGCGAKVAVDAATTGGEGGSGGSPSSSSVATSGTTGSGAGGSTPWTCSGEACVHTEDSLGFTAHAPDGQEVSCPGGFGQFAFSGVVIASAQSGLVIDPCPPGTACDGFPGDIGGFAPGLSFTIPVNAFVRLEALAFPTSFGCAQMFQITNLPTFGGQPNPVSSIPLLWLAGADGTLSLFPDSPFAVMQSETCPPTPGSVQDVSLQFFSFDSPGYAMSASMGQGCGGTLPNGETWLIRDLRSFRDALVPDGAAEMDFAYWIAQGK